MLETSSRIQYKGDESDSNVVHAGPGVTFARILSGFAKHRDIKISSLTVWRNTPSFLLLSGG